MRRHELISVIHNNVTRKMPPRLVPIAPYPSPRDPRGAAGLVSSLPSPLPGSPMLAPRSPWASSASASPLPLPQRSDEDAEEDGGIRSRRERNKAASARTRQRRREREEETRRAVQLLALRRAELQARIGQLRQQNMMLRIEQDVLNKVRERVQALEERTGTVILPRTDERAALSGDDGVPGSATQPDTPPLDDAAGWAGDNR